MILMIMFRDPSIDSANSGNNSVLSIERDRGAIQSGVGIYPLTTKYLKLAALKCWAERMEGSRYIFFVSFWSIDPVSEVIGRPALC